MAVGIPAKKAIFRFAKKFDGVVSVALRNDHLYVQYGADTGKRYFKDFDLQHYSGDEENEPALLAQEAESSWRPMFLKEALKKPVFRETAALYPAWLLGSIFREMTFSDHP